MPNYNSPDIYGDPITTSRPAPAAEEPDSPEPKTSDPHGQCEAKIDDLEEECDALARTLHDLKSHVENTRLDDVFRYPDTVRELMSRAQTLLDGEVPAIVEKKRKLETMLADLITATNARTGGEWEVEEHPDGSWWVLGPDPQDGEDVLVCACEMKQDARHIAEMHNAYAGDTDG